MWTLLLARTSDAPGSFFDRRQLDSGQIKVGRSAKTCDLVLPDDQGFVSREHCTISAVGLDIFVVDQSTNGVALNRPDARIAPNVPVAVRPNDRLLIGDFVITVATQAEGAAATVAPPPAAALPIPPSGPGQGDSWFDPPADPIWDGRSSAVHDFLGPAINEFLAPSSSAFDVPEQPSDFGFADPIGQAFSRPIMADPLPSPGDFAIPEDWASPVRKEAPVPALPPAPISPADWGPLPPPSILDPFDLSVPLHQPSATPSLEDDPPFAAAPSPASSRAAMPAPLPQPASGPDWNAFLEGAGLSEDELQLAPDAMRRLGVLYRQVVLGLWDIIQHRAAFKDEFRVERTQLSMGRNNPLKHLPPLDAAKILLGQPLPGFMDSEDAVRTAFEDIAKHQLAMLAGVQQALVAVFDRLSPKEIEKLIEKASGEKKGLPFRRGIDRWSVYQTVFEALRRDATSNANGVMSVAFREGYEKFLKST
ncbi:MULTISPECIES: type VI secretion system-associated FHA domain protein TagH [Sphingomonas]|nr:MULTISPECIES: type VI secretion system-associated FHA domain protein TagH [Sphingomonas]MBA2920541.1 type VI secretion system-associated FHA domain protein TagH [Sphingomonas sp. CGMCC 1.13658]